MDTKLLPFAMQDVPRYTSYPTAVQFQPDFPGATADQWLSALDPDSSISVYVHIPFCRQLCWYCGCHTSVPNSYDRAERYVEYLLLDIKRSASLFGGRHGRVKHLHFGGGRRPISMTSTSPTSSRRWTGASASPRAAKSRSNPIPGR